MTAAFPLEGVLITSLLLWQKTTAKEAYRRKSLFELIDLVGLESMMAEQKGMTA